MNHNAQGCERVTRMMHLGALVLALVVSSIAAPLAVDAQQPEKVYRIGMLERTSTAINAANLNGFRQGLRELGYVEGKNFIIEYRSVDGRTNGTRASRPSWFVSRWT